MTAKDRSPNFVVIFCDDLGYGDLGCYGNPTIRTPELDRMAEEGMRFTQFYSAHCVCTPSRAALLTGRLPIRSGMCSGKRRVLFPNSKGGLPASEVTIAEMLKAKGYATACVGKWHLGHLPEYLPTEHGFDSYYGIPYSNDMDRTAKAPKGRAAFWNPKIEYWNVPLMQDEKVIEQPADQNTITRHYTEKAVEFINDHQEAPFFLYLAHSMPHVPLFVHPEMQDQSARGLYGDVIEEIDWSVGQVVGALREADIDEHTLVVFTSDNGPWLVFDTHGGTAGLLKDGKGTTWEGGMREPGIFWWPGKIDGGQVTLELGSTLDLLATFASLADAKLPDDRQLDSYDLSPVLLGEGNGPRDEMFYYRGTDLYAVRKGPFKAHFTTDSSYRGTKPVEHNPPALYHLEHDPAERFNVAGEHSAVIAEIEELAKKHEASIKPVENQLEK